jgi:hypothetical protein
MPAVADLEDLRAALLGESDRLARAYGDDETGITE